MHARSTHFSPGVRTAADLPRSWRRDPNDAESSQDVVASPALPDECDIGRDAHRLNDDRENVSGAAAIGCLWLAFYLVGFAYSTLGNTGLISTAGAPMSPAQDIVGSSIDAAR